MELTALHKLVHAIKKLLSLKALFIYKKTYICTRNPLE